WGRVVTGGGVARPAIPGDLGGRVIEVERSGDRPDMYMGCPPRRAGCWPPADVAARPCAAGASSPTGMPSWRPWRRLLTMSGRRSATAAGECDHHRVGAARCAGCADLPAAELVGPHVPARPLVEQPRA